MEIINLTGSTVSIMDDRGGLIISYPPKGRAECEIKRAKIPGTGIIPVYTQMYGKVKGLPAPDDNASKLYIVDEVVADAAKHHRFDLLVPEGRVEKEARNTRFCRGLLNIA